MLKIDLHIHTVGSEHAHCTVLEYIKQAKKLKMKVIGISDHGPGFGDTLISQPYFRVLGRIPKIVEGVRILKGIEANILNTKGDLGMEEKTIKGLDYVMAIIHFATTYGDKGSKINTQSIINAIKSGKINILSHPHSIKGIPFDIKKISEEACKNNVLLEIDVAHFSEREMDETTLPNLKIMLDVVRKYKKKVIVGSDAHNIWELGDDSDLNKYKKEIGLTENMIINNYPKELFKFLKIDE